MLFRSRTDADPIKLALARARARMGGSPPCPVAVVPGHHLSADWQNINMEEMLMTAACKLLSTLFLAVSLASLPGCASTPKQESTGEYVDDTVLTSKVKAAVLNEPSLKVAEINVETFKGVVQLSGFVKDPSDVSKATTVAANVPGVKSVKNDLRVK